MLQLIVLLLVATTIAFANVVEYEVIQDAVKTSQVEMRNEFKESLDENLGLIKKELKAMRADNLALHKELSAARSTIRTLDSVTTTTANSECVDKDEVVKLVSRLLDSHATKQNVLNSRVKVLEEQESRALAPPTPKRKSRRLVDASVLEDAALWMQASGAKVLFGPEADANLYRSGTSELKTDSTVVIKKDLKVGGENWNLATLMEAQEDVAVGDVISMCQGKACVGYGLQHTGYKQSSKAVNQVKTLWMGGTSSLAVMYYLQPGATGKFLLYLPRLSIYCPLSYLCCFRFLSLFVSLFSLSLKFQDFNVPIMRMVKPQDSAGKNNSTVVCLLVVVVINKQNSFIYNIFFFRCNWW